MIFGATGMVGQGVLRECLLATGISNPKLQEVAHQDLWNYSSLEEELSGLDACFFCLGVSSAGMKEADYERVTYGIAVAAADTLARLNPRMTFVYVSGAGADSSEQGRIMWARVKGKTENALLRMPFHSVYIFRPGVIQPLHGIRSKTASYRVLYGLTKPLLPILRWAFPNQVLTTEQVGRAMLKVARNGFPKRTLESRDINAAWAQLTPPESPSP